MNGLIARQVPAHGLTRRFLLQSAVAGCGVFGASRGFATPAPRSISAKDFEVLSCILVGRPRIDSIISGRVIAGLTEVDGAFPQKAADLLEAMRADNLHDMARFDAFSAKHPALRPTAMAIISAWYLGFCGTYDEHVVPAVGQSVDNAQFVSYAAALMYAPTIDATVIPSYSRGRTNYWFHPPKTIASD